MKTAVATLKKEETAQISTRVGRSPFFLIFDEQGALLEVVKNPFSTGGGGAGFGVAKMLGDKGVNSLIGGKFGGNIIGALKERGIQAREMTGTAKEAVVKRQES